MYTDGEREKKRKRIKREGERQQRRRQTEMNETKICMYKEKESYR